VKKLLKRYRYSIILLKQLVKTDFKLRYQGSALGYAWSLLRPLLLFLTLNFVFTRFIKSGSDIEHYPQYLLLGILLWNFFVEITAGSVTAIVGKGDLLRKINFPKYIVIVSNSLAAIINLLLNFIILAIFMYFGHVGISWQALLTIPLIIELYIVALGVAFLLSALFVRFRDISYIWEALLQMAFYATPILYKFQIIPHHIAKYVILNPVAQVIQDARYVLITHDSQTIFQVYGGDRLVWAIPIGLTFVIAAVGGLYFRSRSKFFAEEV
jgi:ABC-2 type transport system permease protein